MTSYVFQSTYFIYVPKTEERGTYVMQETLNDVVRTVTQNYLSSIDVTNPPEPPVIESEILDNIANELDIINKKRDKGQKFKIPQKLEFFQIADILAALYPICRINTAGAGSDTSYDLLAIYQNDGPNEGIYVTEDEIFRQTAEQYNYSLTTREFNECMTRLRTLVPRMERCQQPNLIAVNNGIFDYDTKQLYEFHSKYVFLSKSRVDYNPGAMNINIHNDTDGSDWDIESWMNELSDDPEIVHTLWEVLGAIVRPNVPWGKAAWFYSETGNNGKGTLCELMRQLCGNGSYASIPLSDMGKDFQLEPLVRATAIITDENDVGTYIDKAANLKAIITQDVIQINRKFKQPIPYQSRAFMVQCLNELPKVRDRSDSFFRRQLFIPFTKCFTGHERKYIKYDYLHRTEVLEYVLFKVLNMNYYELSTPQACIEALNDYKTYNDPIRQFIEDILPECTWNVLPFRFLYDLYVSWFKKSIPSGSIQGLRSFINDMRNIMTNNDEWICTEKGKNVRIKSTDMATYEPLLDEYTLTSWMRPNWKQASSRERCTPLPDQFTDTKQSGLVRIQPNIPNLPPVNNDVNESNNNDIDKN